MVLARERTGRSVFVSGFARRRGSHILRSGEHRAFGAPMNQNCTLWTLRVAGCKSVFFASFLCRFGQRNDVPPRTVANSDKEISQPKQTTNTESSNPAMTPTASARTWQPGINPNRYPLKTPSTQNPKVRTNSQRLWPPSVHHHFPPCIFFNKHQILTIRLPARANAIRHIHPP